MEELRTASHPSLQHPIVAQDARAGRSAAAPGQPQRLGGRVHPAAVPDGAVVAPPPHRDACCRPDCDDARVVRRVGYLDRHPLTMYDAERSIYRNRQFNSAKERTVMAGIPQCRSDLHAESACCTPLRVPSSSSDAFPWSEALCRSDLVDLDGACPPGFL